jgi:hypothetical protein
MDKNITIKLQRHVRSPDGSRSNTIVSVFWKMFVVKTV